MEKSFKSIELPVLTLPVKFRRDLSLPQGILYVHSDRGVIRGFKVEVSIGDIVSSRHIASLKIIDYKTKRYVMERSMKEECNRVVYNPPGTISLNSFTFTGMRKGVICVEGEEDLLVIPFSREREVIYGQPDTGIVLVCPDPKTTIKVLKTLKPSMVKYRLS